MTTQYFTYTGHAASAVLFLCNNGGLLFRGRSPQHPSVVVLGSQVHTWWPPRSGMRAQVTELAEMLGYDAEHLTAGRLARKVLKDLVGLDCKETTVSPHYKRIARAGWHWHHLSCIPGYHDIVAEFDLKSAYATSLCNSPSFYFCPKEGYLPDGGALDNFRNLLPVLPKWFRLVLLGVVASYEMQAFTVDRSKPDQPLRVVKVPKISYGWAFNAVHSAILRVFALLDKIKNFGKDYIVRTHTDCYWLKVDSPDEIEKVTSKWVREAGFELVCKRWGACWLQDVNTGVIGGHRLGIPDRLRDLEELRTERSRDIFMRREYPARFAHIPYISGVLTQKTTSPFKEVAGEQLGLWDVI